jgi:hypothetical protein
MDYTPIRTDIFAARDSLNSERYFVVGNHYSEYMDYWINHENYTETECERSEYIYINARDIEGIHLSEYDVSHMADFWENSMGGTQDTFTDIAKRIPDVKLMLESGMDLDDIKISSPELEKCIEIYFKNIQQVGRAENFYVFLYDGRHREMAAKIIDGIIPVKVTRTIRHKGSLGSS